MSKYYSRRELYALGEPLGESVTQTKPDGARIYGSGGGSAGQPGGTAGGDGAASGGGSGGTNPYGTGGIATQSLYSVANGAWCSFLNEYGVWPLRDGVNPVGEWTGYTDTLVIQSNGNYTFRVSGDNHIRIYVNDVLIGEYGDFRSTHEFPTRLSAGTITIRTEGKNDGGPAGFGAVLFNSSDIVIWSTTPNPGRGGDATGYGSGGSGGGNPGDGGSSPGGNGTNGFITLTWG